MKKNTTILWIVLLLLAQFTFAQSSKTNTTKKVITTAQPAKTPTTQTATPLKKDGTPDKRYKSNKKLKKDGTPDKRFREDKK